MPKEAGEYIKPPERHVFLLYQFRIHVCLLREIKELLCSCCLRDIPYQHTNPKRKKPGEIEFYIAESFVPINCLPCTHEIGEAAFVARLRTCVRVIRKVHETPKAPQNRKTIPEKIFEWENN